MSVAVAAIEMPAGVAQRVEALPEALLAILGHLVDPKSLARAGAVGRAWREAAAANGESLWEHASASIPLLDTLQEEYGIQALDSDNGDDDDDEDPNEGRLSYVHVLLLLLLRRRRATPSSPSAAPTPTTTSASFCRSPASVPKRRRR